MDVDFDDFPTVPTALLERLEQLFTFHCPDINISDREIWKRVGQQSVVDFLKTQKALQESILMK